MRRQSLINLFLLISVLVLGLLAWLSPEETTQSKQIPLTALSPSNIQRITIQNNNGPKFVMQLETDGWQMTEPYPVLANRPRIEILMDLLSTPQVEALPLPTERLAEFGLEKPLAVVTFNDTTITFGGTHPFNYRRYVSIDQQLFLINDIFPHHVLAQAESFISHALFPENTQISEISTPQWRLTDNNGTWQLAPPANDVTVEQLQEKVDAWAHTWVSKISKAPKETPAEEVTVLLKGSTDPISFRIIQQKTGTLLVNQALGVTYHLTSDNFLAAPGNSD